MLISSVDVPGTKLWRAVFARDFSSVKILDRENHQLDDFALLA